METVKIEDIRKDPRRYLDQVEAGETLLIVREDRPIAEIKPVVATGRPSRPFGLCAGEFTTPDNFDDPLPEDVLAPFEGR